jgi:hypothetical protein
VRLLLGLAVGLACPRLAAGTSPNPTDLASLAGVAQIDDEPGRRLVRAGDELDRLVRRLQSLSAPAWTSRRESVIATLEQLVELTGIAEHRVMPELPELSSFALADAVAVIGGDFLAALADSGADDILNRFLIELRNASSTSR